MVFKVESAADLEKEIDRVVIGQLDDLGVLLTCHDIRHGRPMRANHNLGSMEPLPLDEQTIVAAIRVGSEFIDYLVRKSRLYRLYDEVMIHHLSTPLVPSAFDYKNCSLVVYWSG